MILIYQDRILAMDRISKNKFIKCFRVHVKSRTSIVKEAT